MNRHVPPLILGLLLLLLSCGDDDGPTGPNFLTIAAAVSAGGFHTCMLTSEGDAYCWGSNSSGQLGTATTQNCRNEFTTGSCSPTPLPVSGGLSFASLSAAGAHTCGLTPEGDAYCWGSNVSGQLGTTTSDLCGFSSLACSQPPLIVSGGLTFASLSGTCGLTIGGDAYCWGGNVHGKLGDGTTTDRLSPVLVSGGLSFGSLDAGSGHTCGVTTGGDAYCWGRNNNGQLGTTTSDFCGETPVDCSRIPVLVSRPLSFASVSAGGSHTCAITPIGDAYCWGSNGNGQLGSGTTGDRLDPVLVFGGLSFTSLSAGLRHTCGVTSGGDAHCWGGNHNGQVGDGTRTDRLSPVPVSGGLSFASLSAAGAHTCGLTPEGDAYCWGLGFQGQLGNNTAGGRSSMPVSVLGLP